MADDELLLDAPDAAPLDTAVILTAVDHDTEMLIDEEGRPRFAPAKNNVRHGSLILFYSS